MSTTLLDEWSDATTRPSSCYLRRTQIQDMKTWDMFGFWLPNRCRAGLTFFKNYLLLILMSSLSIFRVFVLVPFAICFARSSPLWLAHLPLWHNVLIVLRLKNSALVFLCWRDDPWTIHPFSHWFDSIAFSFVVEEDVKDNKNRRLTSRVEKGGSKNVLKRSEWNDVIPQLLHPPPLFCAFDGCPPLANTQTLSSRLFDWFDGWLRGGPSLF